MVHTPEDLLKPCLTTGKVTRAMDFFNVRSVDGLVARRSFYGAVKGCKRSFRLLWMRCSAVH